MTKMDSNDDDDDDDHNDNDDDDDERNGSANALANAQKYLSRFALCESR